MPISPTSALIGLAAAGGALYFVSKKARPTASSARLVYLVLPKDTLPAPPFPEPHRTKPEGHRVPVTCLNRHVETSERTSALYKLKYYSRQTISIPITSITDSPCTYDVTVKFLISGLGCGYSHPDDERFQDVIKNRIEKDPALSGFRQPMAFKGIIKAEAIRQNDNVEVYGQYSYQLVPSASGGLSIPHPEDPWPNTVFLWPSAKSLGAETDAFVFPGGAWDPSVKASLNASGNTLMLDVSLTGIPTFKYQEYSVTPFEWAVDTKERQRGCQYEISLIADLTRQ
jgi:hypothetical protein